MRERVKKIAEAPVNRSGVPAWSFADGRVRAWFLGRGAPERGESAATEWWPADIERAWVRQVHSARVVEARPGLCGEADALTVSRAGLAVMVATADCVPVLLAGPAAVAAVHAGWRGVVAGVVAAAVERLEVPASRGGIRAWIGPAIGPCCYEVGEEVAEAVVAASDPAVRRPGRRQRPHLDLGGAVAAQLVAAGVERVIRVDVCTRCRPEWLWSHRRDGSAAGRNLALVWRGAEPG